MAEHHRKLIDVALPLEAINAESVRENYIYRGNPSSLHKWWAQRPLAACRAVLFAQLVDDPSSRPEEFPTDEAQRKERGRLFGIIEELVKWENISNPRVLDAAKAEIFKSCDGDLPPVLDPFAGGGSIPLEAQRLGLAAYASDLNPVPVLINKALIEIPPRWSRHPPVWPGVAEETLPSDWPGANGLAEDVRRYGTWMHDQAEQRIGQLYPDTELLDGSRAKIVAWIWARTVPCPNPACRAEMPLISTYWLSKKKNQKIWLHPVVSRGSAGDRPKIKFEIRTGHDGPLDPPKIGRRAKFRCLVCDAVAEGEHIRYEALNGRMSAQLLSTVAMANRKRVYLTATDEQEQAADIARPNDVPDEPLADDPRNIWVVGYGLARFSDLFTHRQLMAMVTFSDLVQQVHAKIFKDAKAAGLVKELASDYADAITTYLAFVVSKLADYNSSCGAWYPQEDRPSHLFTRQAIPMVWDFVELNPLGSIGGTWLASLRVVVSAISGLATEEMQGRAILANSSDRTYPSGAVIATDPPYYDNISYADLSDFFYVWLRRSLGSIHADITGTLLTPKSEELVASPSRFAGSGEQARRHFETGFYQTFRAIRESQNGNYPISVYYAFKQSETDDSGVASTGWEAMLAGLMDSGFGITATWPLRTERKGRMVGNETNSLASSIVLACRPRKADAQAIMRAGFVTALQAELPQRLREMQQGAIAPVDLPQAAIGPGMAIFSRYGRVLESDGSPMRVRTALQLINRVLDEVLSEQEGDFDADTRWCLRWFEQHGFDEGPYGEAETLATARNVSVRGLEQAGVLRQGGGKVSLLGFDDLDTAYDSTRDDRPTVWEGALHAAARLKSEGIEGAVRFLQQASSRLDLEAVKELGYVLFSICSDDKRKWTSLAVVFNGLVTSWLDLQDAMRTLPADVQGELSFDTEGE